MKRDQYRVRFQLDRVANDVIANREVEHTMGGDRLADCLGIVGLAVTLRSERVDVHPAAAIGQRPDCCGRWRRRRGQQRSVVTSIDGSSLAGRNDETMMEPVHAIRRTTTGKASPAFAQAGECRDVDAYGVLEADFGHRVSLVADQNRRVRDVFKARVLDPELVRVLARNLDGDRHVLESGADDGEAGHVILGWQRRVAPRRWSR